MLASEFLAHVYRLGALPVSRAQGQTEVDILESADMEIQSTLLPLLRSVNAEYLVRTLDVAAVGGRVMLPGRAAGAAVRLVQLVMPGGGLRNLPQMGPENATGYPVTGGQPFGFYFDGGGIVLLPDGASGTLRVRYHAAPSKLTADTPAPIITVNLDTPTAGITQVRADGSAASALLTGTLDIVSAGPAHELIGIDVPFSRGAPSAWIELDSTDLLGQVSVGDYVCVAGESPVLQIPESLSSPLIALTVARMLRQGGYSSESAQHLDAGMNALKGVAALLHPRSDGNPKRLKGGVLSRLSGQRMRWGW
jgi:hypothetical protein